MKVVALLFLIFAICVICEAKPDRYPRPGPKSPSVCNRGDTFKNSRCYRPCKACCTVAWNSFFHCQKKCNKGDKPVKGWCKSTRCRKGYVRSGARCYSKSCPRGFVPKSKTHCHRPCPKPYKAMGPKCVHSGPKPGECDSYTRQVAQRTRRPFITYRQRRTVKSWYWPKCQKKWKMFPGRKCRGPCRKGYREVGVWCKNKKCFKKTHKYKRAGPKNAVLCKKGHKFKNGNCWKNCPKGWTRQWNNWFRCAKNCNKGHSPRRGSCHTKNCRKGWKRSGARCYSKSCPRGFVPKSSTHCHRPCPRPYKAMGPKCVHSGPKPGECDSYTRQVTPRAKRPFNTYPRRNVPKKKIRPHCSGGWRMERGRCRKLCPKTHTIRGGFCKLTKCIGI